MFRCPSPSLHPVFNSRHIVRSMRISALRAPARFMPTSTCSGLRLSGVGPEIITIFGPDYLRL